MGAGGDLREAVLRGKSEDLELGKVTPGATGFSPGVHLHLEVRALDPVRLVPRTGPAPKPPAPWTIDDVGLDVDGVDFVALSASERRSILRNPHGGLPMTGTWGRHRERSAGPISTSAAGWRPWRT